MTDSTTTQNSSDASLPAFYKINEKGPCLLFIPLEFITPELEKLRAEEMLISKQIACQEELLKTEQKKQEKTKIENEINSLKKQKNKKSEEIKTEEKKVRKDEFQDEKANKLKEITNGSNRFAYYFQNREFKPKQEGKSNCEFVNEVKYAAEAIVDNKSISYKGRATRLNEFFSIKNYLKGWLPDDYQDILSFAFGWEQVGEKVSFGIHVHIIDPNKKFSDPNECFRHLAFYRGSFGESGTNSFDFTRLIIQKTNDDNIPHEPKHNVFSNLFSGDTVSLALKEPLWGILMNDGVQGEQLNLFLDFGTSSSVVSVVKSTGGQQSQGGQQSGFSIPKLSHLKDRSARTIIACGYEENNQGFKSCKAEINSSESIDVRSFDEEKSEVIASFVCQYPIEYGRLDPAFHDQKVEFKEITDVTNPFSGDTVEYVETDFTNEKNRSADPAFVFDIGQDAKAKADAALSGDAEYENYKHRVYLSPKKSINDIELPLKNEKTYPPGIFDDDDQKRTFLDKTMPLWIRSEEAHPIKIYLSQLFDRISLKLSEACAKDWSIASIVISYPSLWTEKDKEEYITCLHQAVEKSSLCPRITGWDDIKARHYDDMIPPQKNTSLRCQENFDEATAALLGIAANRFHTFNPKPLLRSFQTIYSPAPLDEAKSDLTMIAIDIGEGTTDASLIKVVPDESIGQSYPESRHGVSICRNGHDDVIVKKIYSSPKAGLEVTRLIAAELKNMAKKNHPQANLNTNMTDEKERLQAAVGNTKASQNFSAKQQYTYKLYLEAERIKIVYANNPTDVAIGNTDDLYIEQNEHLKANTLSNIVKKAFEGTAHVIADWVMEELDEIKDSGGSITNKERSGRIDGILFSGRTSLMPGIKQCIVDKIEAKIEATTKDNTELSQLKYHAIPPASCFITPKDYLYTSSQQTNGDNSVAKFPVVDGLHALQLAKAGQGGKGIDLYLPDVYKRNRAFGIISTGNTNWPDVAAGYERTQGDGPFVYIAENDFTPIDPIEGTDLDPIVFNGNTTQFWLGWNFSGSKLQHIDFPQPFMRFILWGRTPGQAIGKQAPAYKQWEIKLKQHGSLDVRISGVSITDQSDQTHTSQPKPADTGQSTELTFAIGNDYVLQVNRYWPLDDFRITGMIDPGAIDGDPDLGS